MARALRQIIAVTALIVGNAAGQRPVASFPELAAIVLG